MIFFIQLLLQLLVDPHILGTAKPQGYCVQQTEGSCQTNSPGRKEPAKRSEHIIYMIIAQWGQVNNEV